MQRITVFASLAVLVACGAPDSTLEVTDEPRRITWEEFLTLVFHEEDGPWVANGDEPFATLEELRDFYDTELAPPEPSEGVDRSPLIVDRTRGRDNRWSVEEAHNLTYCVSTAFGRNYRRVVSAMAAATAEWEQTANVNFIHVRAEDLDCDRHNKNVVFDVSPARPDAPYLARAFFPNESRRDRNILVDGSLFTGLGEPTLKGVLRHELGHALGFRHEHTRPEAGRCFEDEDWRPLTPYDSRSVMHYPHCGGTANWALSLTDQDRAGARLLYP